MKITKARLKELIKEELEKQRPRSPGEAPPETLDDLIRRAMMGGIDPYGGGAERFKKDIIRAVKEELGLEELIREELQSEVIGLAFAAKAKKELDKKKKEKKDSDKEKLQKEGSYGGEGSMADSQLNRISDLAMMIDEMVSDETNLPEWVESKITKALDYMSTVMNYMKGEMADAQEEMMEEEKLTKPQIKKRDKRAKEIMKSTKKQYGKEEGEDIAYAIATNQVKEET